MCVEMVTAMKPHCYRVDPSSDLKRLMLITSHNRTKAQSLRQEQPTLDGNQAVSLETNAFPSHQLY